MGEKQASINRKKLHTCTKTTTEQRWDTTIHIFSFLLNLFSSLLHFPVLVIIKLCRPGAFGGAWSPVCDFIKFGELWKHLAAGGLLELCTLLRSFLMASAICLCFSVNNLCRFLSWRILCSKGLDLPVSKAFLARATACCSRDILGQKTMILCWSIINKTHVALVPPSDSFIIQTNRPYSVLINKHFKCAASQVL